MTATALAPVTIDTLVSPVDTWNPATSNANNEFAYIDIASVDAESKQITASKKLRCADAPSRARQIVQVGDVLVSTVRPNLNAVARVPASLDGATASTGFCILRADPCRLSDRYLFHWVRTSAFVVSMVRVATGASYPAVSDRIVRCSPIPLPCADNPAKSLAEQRRIAAILDGADSIRRQRRKVVGINDELIPSLFNDAFRKWLDQPVNAMSQLGNPELAEVVSGVTKGRHFNGQPTVIVPYIRVANVQDGYLDLSEVKTIEALPSDVQSLNLQHGDVLMTEGGDFDKLGRGAMYEADIPDCIHQNHVFRIRCNRSRMLPVFFATYIRTQFAKAYFLKCAKKTSNLASINMTQLRALPVACPPMDLQKRFAREVEVIHHVKRQQGELADHANDLFGSLVQRAFRGEL